MADIHRASQPPSWNFALLSHPRGTTMSPLRPSDLSSWSIRRRARLQVERLEGRIALTDGALDASFGPEFGGYARVPSATSTSSQHDSEVRGLAVQPSGKIVIAYQYPSQGAARLTRFLANGSIDSSFGVNGTAVVTIGENPSSGPTDELRTLLVQPDGKLVLAGTDAGTQAVHDFAVTRLTVDGELDTTFGGDGRSFTFMGYGARLESATLQPDGKIVAVGSAAELSTDTGNQDFAIMRLNTDGSPDSTFGNPVAPGSNVRTGNERMPMDLYAYGYDEARSVVIMPGTNSILVFGFAKEQRYGSSYLAAFARLNPNGSWDSSFAAGGWRYYSHDEVLFDGLYDPSKSVPLAIQPVSGRVILGGTVTRPRSTGVPSGPQPAGFRFLDNGDLDTSFGVGGVTRFDVPTNIGTPTSYLNDLTTTRSSSVARSS